MKPSRKCWKVWSHILRQWHGNNAKLPLNEKNGCAGLGFEKTEEEEPAAYFVEDGWCVLLPFRRHRPLEETQKLKTTSFFDIIYLHYRGQQHDSLLLSVLPVCRKSITDQETKHISLIKLTAMNWKKTDIYTPLSIMCVEDKNERHENNIIMNIRGQTGAYSSRKS